MDFCRKAVLYFQTRMVGNQAQALALLLAMLTAYAGTASDYACVAVLGELASGKTRLVKLILGQQKTRHTDPRDPPGLIPQSHIKHFTSASPTAMIYSEDLSDPESTVRIIEAAEYQKLQQVIIEYFKAQSGDDGTFVYEFTDPTIRKTRKITQRKRVVVFTYAQVELDLELASRYIRFAVEENDKITRAVTHLEHQFPSVEYKGIRYDLKPNLELEQELQDQIEFIASSKPMRVENPFYEALRDLEDCSRPSAKRTARLIEDLFKSSARFNFTEREFVGSDKEYTTIRMSAQDLVNVLSLTDIIQAMILEIDNVDLGILRFLGMRGKAADRQMITNFLTESGLPELKLKEFERRMKNLEDSNYIKKFPDKENKSELWYKLNEFKHVHPLIVHWADALKVDDSEVVNPVTGIRYENIAEFGKEYDEIIRRGLEVNIAVDPKHIPTFEEKLESMVKRLITTGGRYKQGDENRLMKDCMFEAGDNSLGAFETFSKSIERLIRLGVIEVDTKTLIYKIPDPSVKTYQKRETGDRSWLTYVP